MVEKSDLVGRGVRVGKPLGQEEFDLKRLLR
jgi:hypothetical protein